MTLIRTAITPEDIAAVRALCWDYRAHLIETSQVDAEITETFYPEPKYAALMDTLATVHAPPQGVILLAEADGVPLGCAMSHALDPHTSEIKRLFVAPPGRGKGTARDLMLALMAQARRDGFTRVVLDTSVNLHAARALYKNLGFTERGPYQEIPAHVLPHLIFFEAQL